ncbi:MAG: hypothetical protein GKC53_06150 [Neisseriaceae bacterium]|nr:MAG: hypothetical protein GKC53_06150 [Neisseriaceae bacterium]
MVICLCSQITDHQLKESIKNGITTINGLQQELSIGQNCGCCVATARKYIDEYTIKKS